MKVGIIGAMEIEVESLKAEMSIKRTVKKASMDFFEGSTLYVRTDSYYRVNYNYHIYMIKAKEVRIEWL